MEMRKLEVNFVSFRFSIGSSGRQEIDGLTLAADKRQESQSGRILS